MECNICYKMYDKRIVNVCPTRSNCTFTMCKTCQHTYTSVYKQYHCPACQSPRFMHPFRQIMIYVLLFIIWWSSNKNDQNRNV